MPKPEWLADAGAIPFNDPATVKLDPGQKGTAEFEPDTQGSTFYMPTLAASKEPYSTYTIKADDGVIFGPDAGIPPTDIDDLVTTWWPPEEWQTNLTVTIKRLSDAPSAEIYHIQPLGWEE